MQLEISACIRKVKDLSLKTLKFSLAYDFILLKLPFSVLLDRLC